MKNYLLLLIFLLGYQMLHGQEWLTLFNSPDATFQEIEEAYLKHFSTHERARGTGYKHFERWAYFNRQDLNPDGSLPALGQKLNSFKAFQEIASKEVHSDRSENVWSPLGPDNWRNTTGWNPGIGRVNEIAVHPQNPNIIYVGTPQGGLWKTTDSGKNWIPLTDFLPSLGVSGIAISPLNPDVLYIATGDAYASDSYATGVYKSTDGGSTFEITGLNWEFTQLRKMRKMDINPLNPASVIVATTQGLFKSTDGGNIWTLQQSGNFYDVKYKHNDTTVVYSISVNNFYLSENGGDNFTVINNGFSNSGINRIAMATTPANPDKIYLLAGSSDDSGFHSFFVSGDGGKSFTTTLTRTANNNILGYALDGTSEGGQAWYDLAIAASPTDENLIFTGGIHIWYTSDGGYSFYNLTDWYYPTSANYVHADIHYLGFWGDRLYSGNDGGIFFSDNDGFEWTDISPGLSINQIYRMTSSVTESYMLGTGSQDNGCNFLINGEWRHLNGGDGMEVGIDPDNANIVYVASQYGNIRRSTNGGENFTGIRPSSESGAWVTPYKISHTSPNIIYAGYDNLWKTENRGDSWIKITNFPENSNTKINQIAIAKYNPDIVYFTRGESLFKTEDGGNTFSLIPTNGLGTGTITYVNIHPNDPQTVYITYGGYNASPKVFMSNNGGNGFININRNLPEIPVRCITPVEGNNHGVYIGTQFGVFYTDSTLIDWYSYSDGLPISQVNEIDIQYNIGKVRIGTFGRGMWEADLFTPLEVFPIADFDSQQNTICPGDSIRFRNKSLFSQSDILWEFEGGTPATSTELNPVISYTSSGVYSVKIIASNTYGTDTLYIEKFITVLEEVGQSLPIVEIFDEPGPQNLGLIFHSPNSELWKLSSEAAFEGQNALVFENFYENEFNAEKEILSTIIDLTSVENPVLTYRYAFALKSNTLDLQSRLRVFASSDCGLTWTSVDNLFGATLRNNIRTGNYYIPNSQEEWRESIIDRFNDENLNLKVPDLILKFVFVPGNMGNNLWIDNIRIENLETVSSKENLHAFSDLVIYPNPAGEIVNIEFYNNHSGDTNIQLFDALGREVHHVQKGNLNIGLHKFQIITNKLTSGIYFVSIDQGSNNTRHKIMVK